MDIVNRIAGIEQRLDHAERRERRWQLASAALAIGVGMFVASGQAQRMRVVEAEAFVVRDANGLARAQLGIAEDEPPDAVRRRRTSAGRGGGGGGGGRC